MEESKIFQWARRNRIVAGVILIVFGILVLGAIPMVFGLFGTQESYYSDPYVGTMDSGPQAISQDSMYPSLGFEDAGFFDYGLTQKESRTTSTQLDVREGSVGVKSEDAENDFEVLKTILEEQDGYVETSRKNETNTLLLITAQVRLPSENFEEFVAKVQAIYEIEDFQLTNYKMDIQRQIDEMEIIKKALEDYDLIREETLKLENGEERINLLSRITNEMQYLARQQRELERDLGGKQEQSDLATINFTFSQKLRAEIWPEDLGNLFFDRINWAVDSIATTAISLIANSFVLLIKVLEYMVYAVIIFLPVRFVWKRLKKIQ